MNRRFWLLSSPIIILTALALMLAGCSAAPSAPATAPAATPTRITDPTLQVPPGFTITRYATGIGEARMLTFDDQGVLYVAIMDRANRNQGRVLALPDRDQDGLADQVITTTAGLDRPSSVLWHDGALYVSDEARILRVSDTDGDLIGDEVTPVIEGLSSGGDHWARPFVFDADGSILVAIGSTCNACQEGDKSRATIIRYVHEAGQLRGEVFARGLRSVVGLAWQPGTGELWATNNGRDGIGPDLPPDMATVVEQGRHYGWPYCLAGSIIDTQVLTDDGVVTPDGTPKDVFCQTQVTTPTLALPAHVAPLGLTFYQGEQFPEEMRGGLFMAWHGAFDFSNANGFRVVFVPFVDGQPQAPQDFVTGWLHPEGKGWLERPVGVAVGPDGSLYISDDIHGSIYRVSYQGAR